MPTGNSNYGMSPFLLQAELNFAGYAYNKTETTALMEKYHQAYTGIRSTYHGGIEEQLKRDMTLTNTFGRKITFFEQWSNRLLNKAYAWIPQSTIGDMTNTALCNVYDELHKHVHLRLQCHDSLVMQIKASSLSQGLIDDIRGCMMMELTIKNTTFTVPVDVECGLNWYELDDWDDICKHDLKGWLKGKGLS
jgi:DNA polymerase I-like protein with 3'-5' exonuclease and polymerase domains